MQLLCGYIPMEGGVFEYTSDCINRVGVMSNRVISQSDDRRRSILKGRQQGPAFASTSDVTVFLQRPVY
jgi:hypothetical protein